MLNGQFDWGRWEKFTINPFRGNTNDLVRQIFDPVGNGAPGLIDYKSIAVSAAAAYTAASIGDYAGTSYAKAAGQYDTSGNVIMNQAARGYAAAATSHAANYQYAKWAGYDVSWNNRGFAQSVGSVAISQGINKSGLYESTTAIQPNGDTMTVAQAKQGGFNWGSLARNSALNFATGAASYGLGKALGSREHWDTGEALADAFGNALGSNLGRGLTDAADRRAGQAAIRALLKEGGTVQQDTLNDLKASGLASLGSEAMVASDGFISQTHSVRTVDAVAASDNMASVPGYGSWSDHVKFRPEAAGEWAASASPGLSYITRMLNTQTGESLLTTPAVQVTPDRAATEDAMGLLQYALANKLPAPRSADRAYLANYRHTVDAFTRPAWNLWAAETQSFNDAQGFGAGFLRGPGISYVRNDLRDIKADGVAHAMVFAPTAAEALQRGTAPSLRDAFIGPTKLVANVLIDAANLASYVTLQGILGSFLGITSPIPRFSYTTGELTAAGTVEAATMFFGLAKQGISIVGRGVNYAALAEGGRSAVNAERQFSGMLARDKVGWGLREEDFVTFYHGTTKSGRINIVSDGINFGTGNPNADFGRGYYMTKSLDEAKSSAARRGIGLEDVDYVTYKVPGYQLEKLDGLVFAPP